MRGGPLPEPLPRGGLSPRERMNPGKYIKGPSLLTRSKFGAPKSEWERFKDGPIEGNMLEDDNPFNDPFKYHPFKGMAFPPSNYIGPDDRRETDDMTTLSPANALRLKFVQGYTTRKGSRSNLFYNKDGHIVYHAAAVGIVYDKNAHEQLHFFGHDDDITALDMNPKDRLTIVTGQLGKVPKILVWSSRPEKGTRHLPQLCVIHGDHKRAIIGLSFNNTGEYIASMGNDNDRSITLYKWGRDKTLEKMRIGTDKGNKDDVFQLQYNPITDHIVAGGKKYLKFFGLKEGALTNSESAARAAAKAGGQHKAELSESESKIWAKKGTFGADIGAQDVFCFAFDHEGVTYAGTGLGTIFRFAEQASDMAVKAHPLPGTNHWPANDLCRVTAMWFDPHQKVLISSGDDGWLHQWSTSSWQAGSQPNPTKSFDLNQFVIPQLIGTIVKQDATELDKANPKRGRPAAANAIYGDDKGNLIVGTVCNEIYEFKFDDTSSAPMCIVQGHYEEMWGLAMNPIKLEFCTGSEDETLRIWDLERLQPREAGGSMMKLPGPVRCAAYSPDGNWIAVGMGGKNTAHKMNGKWIVVNSATLSVAFEPPQTIFERVGDIKFSPDGQFIAAGYADNSISVYSVSASNSFSCKQVAKFTGHSSSICHIDWSADSKKLQSQCGAHELLYWKLHKGDPGNEHWGPHQEKSSSSMRDEEWATQSCTFGWHVRGVWPEGADGTDINALGRSTEGTRELVVSSDDFGQVKIFRYPCIVPNADNKPYNGHSSHVTNIAFSYQDRWVVSVGGDDRATFIWEVVNER